MNLKEFARLLGLSQTTVSRALRGYPEVKAATRARIQQAAIEHGYHPNRSAVGLATGRAGAVGMVLSPLEFNPLTMEFLAGLGEQFEQEHIDLVISIVSSRAVELATYQRLAESRLVDAVVVHVPEWRDERIECLHELKLPFVLHGRSGSANDDPYIDIDNFGAAKQATDHLLDLGHRRIALINGLEGKTYSMHRDQGYQKALSERRLAVDPKLIGYGAITDEIGYRVMQGFLDRKNPPTAVFAGSMLSALGAMRAIRDAGLSVGEDISLVAHDDVFPYLHAGKTTPALSTTRSALKDAGHRVGEFVIQLLNGKNPKELQEVWPVEFILRESTKPKSHSK
jgi:LacI family transcriptional regulator